MYSPWEPVEECVSRVESNQSAEWDTADKDLKNLELTIELSNIGDINKLDKSIVCGMVEEKKYQWESQERIGEGKLETTEFLTTLHRFCFYVFIYLFFMNGNRELGSS